MLDSSPPNPRLLLKRSAKRKKSWRSRSVPQAKSKLPMFVGLLLLLVTLTLLLSGCASSKPVPVLVDQPKPPLPNVELMTPAQPNFLSRIESFLFGLEQKPMASPTK